MFTGVTEALSHKFVERGRSQHHPRTGVSDFLPTTFLSQSVNDLTRYTAQPFVEILSVFDNSNQIQMSSSLQTLMIAKSTGGIVA